MTYTFSASIVHGLDLLRHANLGGMLQIIAQNGDLPLTGAVAFQQFRNIAFHISTHNSLLFSSWFGLGMKDHRADRR